MARQVQRAGGGKVEIRLPKYGSEREVYAANELLAMLARHIEVGIREPWLFSDGSGMPPHQNTIGHRWRKTLKTAGLSGLRLHDLRHFYPSGLIVSGVRCGDRAAGVRAREGDHYTGKVLALVALGGGPDESRCGGVDGRSGHDSCGLCAD